MLSFIFHSESLIREWTVWLFKRAHIASGREERKPRMEEREREKNENSEKGEKRRWVMGCGGGWGREDKEQRWENMRYI